MLRKFLIFSTLVWLPYGVLCFYFQDWVGALNGIQAVSETGKVEFKAMYGGVQMGMGLLALSALFNASLVRPALMMFIFVCGGMGLARFLAADFTSSVSAYTCFALLLETVTAALAGFCLIDSTEGE